MLAARFRRPWPIIWGIVVATLANHLFAGALGNWVAGLFSPATLAWILAASFAAVAIWTLIPDKLDDDEESKLKRYGPFVTTLIALFSPSIRNANSSSVMASGGNTTTTTAAHAA